MNAITLDQFTVFITIIEEGSFAAAARRLNKTQSAITYTIQKLEEQSDMELFDRSSYRPTLTKAGRALLPRIKRVMDDFGEFKLHAQEITQGQEAELELLVDHFLPLSLITDSLKEFNQAFPRVHLRIRAVWTKEVYQQLIDEQADLGVVLKVNDMPKELENNLLSDIDLVAVAAPNHPLASLQGPISQEVLRDHLQIVVSSARNPNESGTYGIVGVNQWRVSEMRLRYNLILAGIGWGSMPRQMIEKELQRGELVILQPKQWDQSNQMPRLQAIVAKRKESPMGPAASFLFNELAKQGLKTPT